MKFKTDLIEFLLKFVLKLRVSRHLRAWRGDRFPLRLFGNVIEDEKNSSPQAIRFSDGLDGDVQHMLLPVSHNHHTIERYRLLSPQSSLEPSQQFGAQTFACHREYVPVDLPGRRLQVLPGVPVDVEDVALVVGQSRSGGILLQEHVRSHRFQAGLGVESLDPRILLRGGVCYRELDRFRPQPGVKPPVQLRPLAHGLEHVAEISHGLRVP